MARTKQTVKTTEAQSENKMTPVVENIVSEPEVKTLTKVKRTKSKVSQSDEPAPEPVSENVVVQETVLSEPTNQVVSSLVDEAPLVSDNEVSLIAQSDEFFGKLQQLGLLISSLKSEYRVLEKKWSRELKVAQKLNSRRKRKSGNRAPSGFVKPTKISDELANFLGKEVGTEMARTAVTRDINTYIRTNQLQDKENGRKINPDAKLASLLKLSTTDELTYFNLQKYMSPHFHKNVKVEPLLESQVSL